MSDYKLMFFTDDDHDDLQLMEEISESLGHSSQVFNSGADLLTELKSDRQKPHIIFLDITMPKVDGFEVLEQMRSIEEYKDIPIVIHSANCDKRCLDRAFKLGANYYLSKAYTYAGVRETIRNTVAQDWETFKPLREDFLYQYSAI